MRCKKCGGLLFGEKIYDELSQSAMVERCANCSRQTDEVTEENRKKETPPAKEKTKRFPKYIKGRKVTKQWWS